MREDSDDGEEQSKVAGVSEQWQKSQRGVRDQHYLGRGLQCGQLSYFVVCFKDLTWRPFRSRDGMFCISMGPVDCNVVLFPISHLRESHSFPSC